MSLYQWAMLILAWRYRQYLERSEITAAYRFAPARELSVYDYSQVVFSAILGFFVFHQIPAKSSGVCWAMSIIAIAVAMAVYNNRRDKQGKLGKLGRVIGAAWPEKPRKRCFSAGFFYTLFTFVGYSGNITAIVRNHQAPRSEH